MLSSSPYRWIPLLCGAGILAVALLALFGTGTVPVESTSASRPGDDNESVITIATPASPPGIPLPDSQLATRHPGISPDAESAMIAAAPLNPAQRGGRRSVFRTGADGRIDRRGVPDWKVDERFKEDVFTFVRVQYNSYYRWQKWATDYPDSDLNFSFRLQQLTSMHVDPDGKVLQLTDPELFNYPFIYMIEPGELSFEPAEVDALRRYLTNGGFMMVDDFWGNDEYANFYRELKRVFPNREPEELPLEHPIFHCVYDLVEKPQVPSIGVAQWGAQQGITWERPDAEEVHYKGVFDDEGRMMVIICHNTDLGDGWEREGEDQWYFKEFSEKKAYPMGINIVFYAMTH